MEGDDVVGVGAQGGPELAGEAKIADLELSAVAIEDVAGLEVSVQHPVVMQVGDARKQLAHQALHLRTCEQTPVSDNKFHILDAHPY